MSSPLSSDRRSAEVSASDERRAEAVTAAGSGDPEQPAFAVGEPVRLAQRPGYLKSADPMPMLRPPDLVDEGEAGVVVELRSHEQRAVRFRRGTFLLTVSQLRRSDSQPPA